MLATQSLASSSLQRASTAPTPLVDSSKALTDQWSGIPNTRIGRINRLKNISGIGSKPATRAHEKGTLTGTDVGHGNRLEGSGRSLELAIDVALASRSSARSPPLVSPRRDIRDDPFSLTGFFPSRPGSPEHSVEWAWRSSVEDETAPEEAEEEVEERIGNNTEWRSIPSTRSLSMNALDEYAREVIAKESRLGILGLARVPSFSSFLKSIRESYFGRQTEENQQVHTQSETTSLFQMYTPAAIDEPFDLETLRESMHSRRVASEGALSVPERVPSLGLFSPATDADEAGLDLAGGLYSKILGREE